MAKSVSGEYLAQLVPAPGPLALLHLCGGLAERSGVHFLRDAWSSGPPPLAQLQRAISQFSQWRWQEGPEPHPVAQSLWQGGADDWWEDRGSIHTSPNQRPSPLGGAGGRWEAEAAGGQS